MLYYVEYLHLDLEKCLIDILYKRPRNVLNNNQSIYRPSNRTNPPTRQR
jgi:hypothetical protein